MDKSKLVFLDTETTGNNPEARLCQVAYKFSGKEVEGFFKPPIPISIDAMAISHITNKMVEDEEVFSDSQMKKDLEKIFSEGNILVAHNADFDSNILKNDGIIVGRKIDTVKIAQYLDEKGDIPRYSLQYLRYYFDLDLDPKDAPAHNALGDIRVLEKLFDYLFEKMEENLIGEEEVLEKMLEISVLPVLMKKFGFGKYKGEKVEDVYQKDPGYLKWLWEQKKKAKEQGEENDENWIYTLEYYLK
jgi:exodeoxyribonuclease X